LETERKKRCQEKEIMKTRKERRDQPDSQRRKTKKPLQKEDDSSKGLKGGQ
jgi:hypothetical protein